LCVVVSLYDVSELSSYQQANAIWSVLYKSLQMLFIGCNIQIYSVALIMVAVGESSSHRFGFRLSATVTARSLTSI